MPSGVDQYPTICAVVLIRKDSILRLKPQRQRGHRGHTRVSPPEEATPRKSSVGLVLCQVVKYGKLDTHDEFDISC
jgi:hypothetical protein